jgi:sporulation integral membrane protein YlbJ
MCGHKLLRHRKKEAQKLDRRKAVGNILSGLACAALCVGLLFYPTESVEAAKSGLKTCAELIIPSLFPFFVLSSFMIELGIADALGRLARPIMRGLFGLGGNCSLPFLLGFVGGYPVGARSAISLYERGEISKGEALRLLSFCNNSGPAFILGVVGAGVFCDSKAGLLLYLIHFLSSVAVGLIFRGYRVEGEARLVREPEKKKLSKSISAKFTSSVGGAFTSVLGISAFVIFFSVAIRLLIISGLIPAAAKGAAFLLRPLGVTAESAEELISGMIEMTSGVSSLRGAAGSLGKNAVMAAFMLGWAGLSVHFQVLAFLTKSGLSSKTYILGKLLHAVISALLAAIVFSFYKPTSDVALVLADEIVGLAEVKVPRIILLTVAETLPFLPAVVCGVVKKLKYARSVEMMRKRVYNDLN